MISAPRPTQAQTDRFAILKDIVEARYSCRAFKPQQVSNQTIEDIVSLAGRTASGCNAQPWHVVVTSGPATERFRDALMQEERSNPGGAPDYDWPVNFTGAYKARRRECGAQLYASLDIAPSDRESANRQAFENFRLFGAPHVAIITIDRDLGTYGAIDGGAFVTSFMLAAQTLGIATVPQASLALHGAFTRTWFGLSESRKLLCGISFGYADKEHPINSFRTSRAILSDILTIEE